MSILLVASTEPRVGRSLIAAALAYRLGVAGQTATLARLAGDEGAAHDAATFARLEGITAPGTACSAGDVAAITGAVIAEAPPGPAAALAEQLQARVIAVGVPGSAPLDVPAERIAGVILTRVPAADLPAMQNRAGVLAALPEDRVLAAPAIDEIGVALDARDLAGNRNGGSIDRVMIGTIASDAATPYFAQRERICVVTRFDKTDLQLAALQADVKCLVLTGGGEPSPYLLDRVRGDRDAVSVLLSSLGTVEAIRAIEPLFGVSRFDGAEKLARAVAMLDAAAVPLEP
jgi:BioD-like phosphotransacetylase family protein